MTRLNAGEDAKETESLIHGWWECKMLQPFGKRVGNFLKKLTDYFTTWQWHKTKVCAKLYMKVQNSFIRSNSNLETRRTAYNR